MMATRESWAGRALNILFGVCIGMLLLLVAFFVYSVATPTAYQPITFDTVRVERIVEDGTVTVPQVEGFEAPSMYVGETVPVLFNRCSDQDETFEVLADTYFYNPRTMLKYPASSDIVADIEPGCVTIRIEVPMPDQMIADIRAFGDEEAPTSDVWLFSGELNPEPEGAENSTFESEQFIVVQRPQE